MTEVVPVPDLLASRLVRVVVLVAALGVGGVAGAPVMTLPPRVGVTMSGGDDPDDGPGDDGPGGGGGGYPPNGPRNAGGGVVRSPIRAYATVG